MTHTAGGPDGRQLFPDSRAQETDRVHKTVTLERQIHTTDPGC